MLTFDMKLLILILLAALGAQASNHKHDRLCGSDPANLWLDVVLVVDSSRYLQECHDGYTLKDVVISTIDDLFGNGTRIGRDYSDPRSTRVSLVTYEKTATVVADLNKYQSFSQLSNGVSSLNEESGTWDNYLYLGLTKADEVLTAGRSNNYRTNYQQLVIVFAANYFMARIEEDPIFAADRLKKKNVTIAVVDFSDIEYDHDPLRKIASPEMYTFWEKNMHDWFLRPAIFQVNCFCPRNWIKYNPAAVSDITGYHSGLCLQVSNLPLNWAQAKLTCQNMVRTGYLVTEFTTNKHQFNQLLINSTGTSDYHIGLTFLSGNWYWEQPLHQNHIEVYRKSQEDIFWNEHYPMNEATNTSGANMIGSNGKVGWQNINTWNDKKLFICERYACDTDNYCE